MTTVSLAIREAIADAIDGWEVEWHPAGPDTPRATLESLIHEIAAPLVDSAAATLEAGGGSAWEPLRADAGPQAIWRDLRPSQAVRLIQLVEAAAERAREQCEPIIREALVAAGVAFVEEYPDVEIPAVTSGPETIVAGAERLVSSAVAEGIARSDA